MAKYFKGILGPFSGLVGTVVGAIWNGVQVMRSRPVQSNRPPTQAQQNTRAKLQLVSGFLRQLRPLIDIGYQQYRDGLTPMNAATGYHLRSAVTGSSSMNYSIDYPKVMFSTGRLLPAADAIIEAATPAQMDFSWTNDAPVDSTGGTDRAMFLVYNPVKDKFVVLISSIPRSAGAHELSLPLDFSGDEVHCWLAFVSVNGKEVSDSMYIGTLPVVE